MRLVPLLLLLSACLDFAADKLPEECPTLQRDAPPSCPSRPLYRCGESRPGDLAFRCRDGEVYQLDLSIGNYCDCYTDEPVCPGAVELMFVGACDGSCSTEEVRSFASPAEAAGFDPLSLCVNR
jgi:hypothetical protein